MIGPAWADPHHDRARGHPIGVIVGRGAVGDDSTVAEVPARLAAVAALRGPDGAEAGAHAPELCRALIGLGTSLLEAGEHARALTACQEALELARGLPPATTPATRDRLLAAARYGAGVALWNTERFAEGLAALDEALETRRRLVADPSADPATQRADLGDLAESLTSRRVALVAMSQPEQAAECAGEAVRVLRRLAASEPPGSAALTAVTVRLARTVGERGNLLADLDRSDEWLACAAESVALFRAIDLETPGVHTADLAATLDNLQNALGGTGRHEEGLAAGLEGAALRRRLVADDESRFAPDLATSLGNLAHSFSALGRHEEARECAEEAVVLQRRLLAGEAGRDIDLARALGTLAMVLARAGRDPEAAWRAIEESLNLLHRVPGAAAARLLRTAYVTGSNVLDRLARYDEAARLRERAAALRQDRR